MTGECQFTKCPLSHDSVDIFFYNRIKQTKVYYMLNQTSLNLTDLPKKDYNGWSDWTTWNCALWVGGDEGLYNLAKDCESWFDFIICMQDMGMNKTPDGAKWTEADYDEMMEMMDEL